MLCVGSLLGAAGGLSFGRLVQSLLFQVRVTDPLSIVTPLLTLGVVAALAALAPAARAVRIDPAQTLRGE